MPENPKNLRPLSKKEILNAKAGDILYSQDGRRWKITSVQTWKRKPEDRSFGLQYGLYGHDRVDYTDGRWNYEMMKGPDTRIEAPKAVKGVGYRIGQTVVLEEAHPDWAHTPIPVGMAGEIKGIREIPPEQAAQYHSGQRAFLEIKWARGGTTYNTYPKQVKVKKPRLSR